MFLALSPFHFHVETIFLLLTHGLATGLAEDLGCALKKIPGGLGRAPSTQRQLRGLQTKPSVDSDSLRDHDSDESVGGSPWKDVMH